MKMNLYQFELPLAHEFTIARGSITTQPSLIVELEHDGIRGYGEATENSFYGHTFASMSESLDLARPLLERYLEQSPVDVWPAMLDAVRGDMFALSALDMAAHDLRGKRLGIPTWQDWGLTWTDVVDSSYTIGIDTIETMLAKLDEQPGWSIYKIKLGTPHDIEIVRELRRHTEATFRVDANCGWSADETVSNSKELAELGVEFIEQPLPIDASREDKLKVFEQSILPIVADEDCQTSADVAKCEGLYHGVNVKICKCGGLTPALQMLRDARARGMKTMVGCMVESSVGISGAAQLLPLLDYADLDGAVLLKAEPARGVAIQQGKITLPDRPGTGAELIADRIADFLCSRV
ncbi:MAG TPA: dipeptide epimerase [Planctomycetaceae bacterium]|nr:dipeptide epimerase [Planctomycetaceae bacterium]